MTDDFNLFVDSVLLEVANRQTGKRVKGCEVGEVCRKLDPKVPPTWIGMVGDRFRKLNYGHFLPDSDDPEADWFYIEGAGIARAAEIRKLREPLGFTDHLASEKVQKIGSLLMSGLSLLVSIAAFVVAYLAYAKQQ